MAKDMAEPGVRAIMQATLIGGTNERRITPLRQVQKSPAHAGPQFFMTSTGRFATYFFVAASAAYILFWLWGHPSLAYLGPFFGSILITIGWMVTSHITVRNAQRQHTVTIISHYNEDKSSQEFGSLIVKYWPDATTPIAPRDGADNAADYNCRQIPSFDAAYHELFAAMDYELNALEFMSVAVFNETMDEQMLKDSLKTRFTLSRKLMRLYIEARRQQYGTTIWCNFSALCDKWENESDDFVGL